MTRVLFLGDVFAKTGRYVIKKFLTDIILWEKIDLALANGENTSGGLGLMPQQAQELLNAGLAALSGGNHTFKHPELKGSLNKENSRVIRPANYPDPCPGRGFVVLETASGVKVGFGNLIGRLFMNPYVDCPFKRAEKLITEMTEAGAQITIIDFHAEATSEKRAMAWFLDGRLGALLGTHTHVQTSDARIMPGGLAYITDCGMTGPHQSIIGMHHEEPLANVLTGRHHHYKAAKEDPTLEGVIIEFNHNGLATEIKAIRVKSLSDLPSYQNPSS